MIFDKSYCIIDLETPYGIWYNKVGNPFVEENQLVSCGIIYSDKIKLNINYRHAYETTIEYWKALLSACDSQSYKSGLYSYVYFYSSLLVSVGIDDHIPADIFNYDYIVAQNSHFELLWILRFYKEEFLNWIERGGKLVCTQFNHYKLTNQIVKGRDLALDKIAPLYGGYRKVDIIKKLWGAGVETKDINKDLLDYYLEYDVYNTWLLFTSQYKQIVDSNMLNYYEHHWDFMVLTGLMEYFGKYIDIEKYNKLRSDIDKHVSILECKIKKLLVTYDIVWNVPYTINLASGPQLSAVLFGGLYECELSGLQLDEQQEPVRFKSGANKGKIKVIKSKQEFKLKGILNPSEYKVPKVKKGDYYATSSDILENYKDNELVKLILEYRAQSKLLTTYLARSSEMSNSVHPDSCIRSSFCHYNTYTGRTSSNNPNLQNQDNKSELRAYFSSRFGEEGRFVSADFSGLENRTNAHITGDQTLINDLREGLCLHKKTASVLFNVPYDDVTPDMRKQVKPANFGDAYGQSAGGLAANTGLDLEWCKEFKAAKRQLYPMTYFYYEDLYLKLQSGLRNSSIKTKFGYTLKKALWANSFGYNVGFLEGHAPYWLIKKKLRNVRSCPTGYIGRIEIAEKTKNRDLIFPIPPELREYRDLYFNLSPTQVKNYPNQNMAAEISTIVGSLFLTLLLPHIKLNNIIPVSFVHDEYNFDCRTERDAKALTNIIDSINTHLLKYIKKTYNVDLLIEFPIEYKVGLNWKECH